MSWTHFLSYKPEEAPRRKISGKRYSAQPIGWAESYMFEELTPTPSAIYRSQPTFAPQNQGR